MDRDSSPPPPNIPAPTFLPPIPARSIKISPECVTPTVEQPPLSQNDKSEEVLELDEDEISQHMTQSYSEISFKSSLSPENEDLSSPILNLDTVEVSDQFAQRPATLMCEKNEGKSLRPLNLDGTVRVEGNMTHFVAEDLETKIKLSSPISKKNDTPNTLYRQLLDPQGGQIDMAFINDLECEAQRMATSVDSLIENLSGILHSISSITADNVDVYKNAVSKMSDAMDGNIKSMYTMMAKTEEVTQNMKGVEAQAAKIKNIKKLVDLFESFV
ncbi:BLOC-1 related complex subunit 6 [Rhynchophorus ferrugineus]|uniref:BLOC-1 related complex subunit 6 n=1 Tax=Rhynchophorus ferrugineus TaxID=354439 RepID=UPI003FCC6C78